MQKFAWAFVGYLIFVILFGAWVRISGSGAGCGNHWPTCQGVVLPVEPSVKTIIEFTHRITSGLSGIVGLWILLWAWRKKSAALGWAAGLFFFLLVEGFIGAVLVKKELVADDASLSRAIVISLHLVNTMLLMLCAVGTAIRLGAERYRDRSSSTLLYAAMAALVVTNATGAITALGDTLFPVQPAMGPELLAKIKDELSPSHHFLVRMRILHPVIAGIAATFVFAEFVSAARGEPVGGGRYGFDWSAGHVGDCKHLARGASSVAVGASADSPTGVDLYCRGLARLNITSWWSG